MIEVKIGDVVKVTVSDTLPYANPYRKGTTGVVKAISLSGRVVLLKVRGQHNKVTVPLYHLKFHQIPKFVVDMRDSHGNIVQAKVGDLFAAYSFSKKRVMVVRIESIKKRFSLDGWKNSPKASQCIFIGEYHARD